MPATGALISRARGLMLRGGLSTTVLPLVEMLRIVPISREIVLNHIVEHVLGVLRSSSSEGDG